MSIETPTRMPAQSDNAPTAPPPVMPANAQQALTQLGSLIAQLAADPQARPEVLKLIRRAVPGVPIPELDLAEQFQKQMEAKTKPVVDELDQLKSKLESLSAVITRNAWAQQKGLSEEELKEVEKLAEEKKLPDAETAYELWEARRARLGTPRATPGPMEGLTKDDWKELSRRPGQWAQRKALEDLAELRRARRVAG
jgi:Skp family chaperone for outer membrane proteins